MELLVLIIYGLFSIFMVIIIIKKDNYHMDELFSYGSSNNYIYLSIKPGKYDFPYNIFFKNYLIVNMNSRFNYYKVWKNQSKDVHPPIYYAILHTICSFFPEKFSRWYAGSINIFFALLFHLYLYCHQEFYRQLLTLECIFLQCFLSLF